MMNPFTEELRSAVANCGVSQRAIARETGIDVAMVNKFIHGTVWLGAANIDKLAAFLDLHVAKGRRYPKESKAKGE